MARAEFTAVEQWIDDRAHRVIARGGLAGHPLLVESIVFVLKQAWACIFGASLLAVIVAVRLWWPDTASVAANDVLFFAAVGIQLAMLVFRLETVRELWVVALFHIVGTVMELFKTDVGSWAYAADGIIRIGGVPLFTGFMYAAVGSYMVRTMRLFDLRFSRYPPLAWTVVVAVLIYANFFLHHYVWDARWLLVAGVAVLWGRCVMHVRVLRSRIPVPLLVAFALTATVIWLAENIATAVGTWSYPDQVDGWHMVAWSKIISWFLLMTISVVLVTLVHRPRAVSAVPSERE